ncbi:hypothetical protein LMG23992_02627 [Cupriavidus laharis]|uniref:N-acetyltransferase domain-containing protein n=1 Tax=Cupriavidus laharis TaxID=151654 RepID=A0ABM8X2J8_9BURK|nr:GNAT family N-acetyltransferase [Cupriavidus laharis]CAG9174096.1 hypothetical protein LMG23992_02627 [Cupriavidus laharis]
MRANLLDITSNAWRTALERCSHDCHHTPAWMKAAERSERGRALAVHVTDGAHELLVPFVRRDLTGGLWDATSAYGYGGPLVSTGAPADFADAAFRAAVDMLREAGCVSCFLRLHPLLNTHWKSSVGLVLEQGMTVSIDLRKPPEKHWQETQSRHKLGINRARRAGVTVRVDREFETLSRFIDIYNQTMTRRCATDYYFFDKQYYRSLVNGLGDNLLLLVAEEAGHVIGGALFTLAQQSGIMQYHLSGSDWDYRHRQPTKIIIHTAREWGRMHGFSRLHLGGGLGSAVDSLHEFKRGFSPDTHMFSTQRVVVSREAYHALSAGRAASDGDLRGYFPAYRRPVVAKVPAGSRLAALTP